MIKEKTDGICDVLAAISRALAAAGIAVQASWYAAPRNAGQYGYETWCIDKADNPFYGVAGSYVLALYINMACPLPRSLQRTSGMAMLPPGYYVYEGSAYGRGGMFARISRHLRPDKTQKWHIDYATCAAVSLYVLPVIAAQECALCAAIQQDACFYVPVPGFGSSDCQHCPAHVQAFIPKNK
jgi:Uri superfamily endonuclease